PMSATSVAASKTSASPGWVSITINPSRGKARRIVAADPGTTENGSGCPASSALNAHSVAEACGSASTTVTVPWSVNAVAKKTDVTVLETPPLGFKTVMTVLMISTIPPEPQRLKWVSGGTG